MIKKICEKAIEILKHRKVSFGDIRLIEERTQNIVIKNHSIAELKDDTTIGFGIRVLYNGGWGFASSNILTLKEVEKIAEKAIDIAKSSSTIRNSKVKLAYEPAYEDIWVTPILKDPFKVSLEEKIDLLLKINETLLKNSKIKVANSKMSFIKTHKYFYSTEGSKIEQVFYYSGAGYSANAIDNDFQTRSYPGGHAFMLSMGYEYIDQLKLLENAERIREEAVALLTAPNCPDDEMDLIIYVNQLVLQIHESTGHAS